MSEIQKCPNLVRGGGVSIFQKCLKFKNVPKVGGGGSTLIGTLSQISSIFYFDASPNKDNLMGFDTIESNLVLDIVPFAY